MSTYQKSFDDIVSLINAKATLMLTASQLNILGMIPTPAGESTYNTKMRVSVISTDPTWRGEKTFYYDRLNLARFGDLLTFLPEGRLRIPANLGVSSYALFSELRDALGVQFETTEIEDTTTYLDSNDGVSLLLKAKPKARGWTGEFIVKFKNPPNIATAFYSTNLIGF